MSFAYAYLVHSDTDRRQMLNTMGLSGIDELFATIPDDLRLSRPLDLPAPLTAIELQRAMRRAAADCETTLSHLNFLGGGFYDHFVHPVVDAIVSRGEFLTSYTPYQPTISQGMLGALHDYQALTSRIAGLPVVNSSCYDGATAMADAAWMACTATGRRTVVLARTVWPEWRDIVTLYLSGRGVRTAIAGHDNGTGRMKMNECDADDVAAVICQCPNALGVIEDISAIAATSHSRGSLAIAAFNPLLSGVAEPPGRLGADIVCAEGQPLGLYLNGGGPGLGMLACSASLAPYMTGRIVAASERIESGRYELVRQEREQHVARERALSNICSNQALCAVRVAVHLTLLGETGYAALARTNMRLAQRLMGLLTDLPGVTRPYSGPFFNEFTLRLPCPAGPVLAALRKEGIFGGLEMSWTGVDTDILVAVTETKTEDDLSFYAEKLAEIIAGKMSHV
ncbi:MULTISPECIES: aminomethyl-transferring glycine dehydrogenase subunit GcvPA [unclassified Bradyrhizobium]|uniref:aminomethyl-transferring glycine dehydrogenase subunit GcvPA n=1 Tax=unclassified Bradyrhizobium TaxID=2631580 RepID=UPI00291620D1|nr:MULTISPECIES: aminomethyl-transferring glycine dehydrogenase subunit GcvPA [unclassified Bradyrhizobium]